MSAITIGRQPLVAALQQVIPAVPARPVNPTLGNVRLTLADGLLTLLATDTSVWARRTLALPSMDSLDILLPADKLFNICKGLTAETVTLDTDGTTATLRSARSKYDLPCLDVALFPAWPEERADPICDVPGVELAAAIADVGSFAEQRIGDGRVSYQHAVAVQLLPGQLAVYACGPAGTTAYLACVRLSGLAHQLDRTLMPPAGACAALLQSLGEGAVALSAFSGGLIFDDGKYAAIVPLLDVRMPDYERILRGEREIKISLDTAELRTACQRLLNLAGATEPWADFSFSGDTLVIETVATEMGRGREELACLAGDEVTQRFSLRYMLQALKPWGDAPISIELNQQPGPALITSSRKPDAAVALMAVRI